jgi:hypothetical protein
LILSFSLTGFANEMGLAGFSETPEQRIDHTSSITADWLGIRGSCATACRYFTPFLLGCKYEKYIFLLRQCCPPIRYLGTAEPDVGQTPVETTRVRPGDWPRALQPEMAVRG